VNYDIQDNDNGNKKTLTSDAIRRTVNYLSEALDKMQIAHTIECHKYKVKITKPLQMST
jgi:hypothetical protein